ncbi:MAG TPA: alpha/beta fold hydrolase [Terriglobales bacterium]|nr:alpha/beta fold hydrolase [Terriglobales bacterium]
MDPAQKSSPLADAFIPRRGMSNPHVQTLAGNFLPRTNLLPPPEERLFDVEPEVQVLCHCHWQPEKVKHEALTVIIVHGLEGSTSSKYVIGLGSKAWAKGMNVVRMNMRNCGGTEQLTPTLYHSGLSQDVGAVAQTLIEQDRLRRVALVGYSMGGNLVMKLAGEWGGNAPKEVIAVAGVSPAMDLAPSADALHDPANRIYEWKFLWGLRNRYRRKVQLFPQRYESQYARFYSTIREFDHEVTARYSGFTSASDYYERASSSRVADRVAVPALVIHSLDDPFIRMAPDTRAKLLANPHVRLIETAHGGHCAFLAEANGHDYDGRWAEQAVVEFFQQQLNP